MNGTQTADSDLQTANKQLRREIGRVSRKNFRFEQELIRMDKTAQANEVMNLNRLAELDRLTKELAHSKKEIDDILANVRQGILTVSSDGIINNEFSRKTADIFDREDLGGQIFADLFPVDGDLRAKIQKFMNELFTNTFMAERMFAKVNPLNEYHFQTQRGGGSAEKVLSFAFSRIFATDMDGKPVKRVEKVMIVVDDRTHEYELARELENKAREQAQKVEKLYQILRLDPVIFTNFIREAAESLDAMRMRLAGLGDNPEENKHIIQECFRSCHTLKGNARAMNLDTVSETAHKLEDVLAKVREHPETFTPEIKEQVVQGMHALQDEIQDGNSLFSKILNMKDALTVGHKDPESEFEESVHSIVKKESTYAEKNVQLVYVKETKRKLSPVIVKRIRGPVIQLLRNAIDHGLEPTDVRTKAGKPEAGTIRLTVTEENGTLLVVCEDDGQGLSADTIKAKAVEKKVISDDEARSMNSHDLYRLIFESGFSTAPRITELSGRGVGMDVIVGEMKDMKGRIYVRTRPGEFTRFTLRIPDGFNEGEI